MQFCYTIQFADNLTLIEGFSKDNVCLNNLHHIEGWIMENDMVLNKEKYRQMVILRSGKLSCPVYDTIKVVDSLSILGMM